MYNYQVHLNMPLVDSLKIDKEDIIEQIIQYCKKQKGISQVFAIEDLNEYPLPLKIRSMLNNVYFPTRSGQVQLLFTPGYIDGFVDGTS